MIRRRVFGVQTMQKVRYKKGFIRAQRAKNLT